VSADWQMSGLAWAKVLILSGSLWLGACTADDTGKNGRPVIFGTAGGGNGGGGATSEMRLTW
jgi:hypothetical protein